MIKSSIILAALVALLAPNGARPQGVPECTCSPKAFQFIISLDLDPLCKNNDIEGNTGITNVSTGCFVEAGIPPDKPIFEGLEEEGIKDDEGMIPEELNPDFVVKNVTSSIFKEKNEDGDIITETKQYYGTTLENGDFFFSVSSSLDPSVSLEDQIEKVPYSVEIRLFGYNEEGDLISNIIRWSYDMSCGSDPIQTGDTIGWITVGDLIGPWPQFCPKVPSPSPSYSMSYGKASKTMTKTKAYNSKMGN
eukprot:scaffold625_cov169-Skeletonema_dohrnii-CCMP3373.AAC.3